MKLACDLRISNGELVSGYLVQVVPASDCPSGWCVMVVDAVGKLHFGDAGNITVLRREVAL